MVHSVSVLIRGTATSIAAVLLVAGACGGETDRDHAGSGSGEPSGVGGEGAPASFSGSAGGVSVSGGGGGLGGSGLLVGEGGGAGHAGEGEQGPGGEAGVAGSGGEGGAAGSSGSGTSTVGGAAGVAGAEASRCSLPPDRGSCDDSIPAYYFANSALIEGRYVWLGGNPIDCEEQAANIQALRDRGVNVEVDCP